MVQCAPRASSGPNHLGLCALQTFVDCIPNPNSCGGTGGCSGSTEEYGAFLHPARTPAELRSRCVLTPPALQASRGPCFTALLPTPPTPTPPRPATSVCSARALASSRPVRHCLYLVCSTALRGEDERPSHPHTTVSDVSGAGVERFLSGRFCSRRHLELRQAPGQRLRLADGRPR